MKARVRKRGKSKLTLIVARGSLSRRWSILRRRCKQLYEPGSNLEDLRLKCEAGDPDVVDEEGDIQVLETLRNAFEVVA